MNEPFNPATDVSSKEEMGIAARWECLRRNTEFQRVADRWISDAPFRFKQIEDDPRPRCALWWMLDPDEACILAKELAKSCKFKPNEGFNFGPIHQQFHASRLKGPFSLDSFSACYVLTPDRRHKSRLSHEHNWLEAPSGFRKQFLFACTGGKDFHIHNGVEIQRCLMRFTKRLLECKEVAEAHSLGWQLYERIHELREYSEKLLVLDVGDKSYPRWRVKELLEQIRRQIRTMPGHYEEKRSWYGTEEDWRWFLAWEANGQNVRAAAKIYINEKSPVGTTKKSVAARERDARSTIRKHVQVIERWIEQSYPASQ